MRIGPDRYSCRSVACQYINIRITCEYWEIYYRCHRCQHTRVSSVSPNVSMVVLSDVLEWKRWKYLDFSPSTLRLLHMLHADIPTPMESHGFCHDDGLKITAERWYRGKIECVVCSYHSGVLQTLYKSGRTPGWRRKSGIPSTAQHQRNRIFRYNALLPVIESLNQDTSHVPLTLMSVHFDRDQKQALAWKRNCHSDTIETRPGLVNMSFLHHPRCIGKIGGALWVR